jgi:hypothetical protein
VLSSTPAPFFAGGVEGRRDCSAGQVLNQVS